MPRPERPLPARSLSSSTEPTSGPLLSAMRHVYVGKWEEKITLEHNRRVYSDPVPQGWVLKVLTSYIHMPDCKAGDLAQILLQHGGQELVLRCRVRDLAKHGMSTLNPYYVGEHRRIIGYAPDSDVGDVISLNVVGEMIPLKRWRKGKV